MAIEPKEVTITDQAGRERRYILHKFNAIAGREIISKYPTSNFPKIGEYEVSEATMLKLMSFVAVEGANGNPMFLTTRALVDNHVPDWETLVRIEFLMMEYNCSFFQNGKGSTFLSALAEKARPQIMSMLTDLLQASSPKEKRRSRN